MNGEQRCADCVFYATDWINTNVGGLSEPAVRQVDYGYCRRTVWRAGEPEHVTTKAWALDGEEYYAVLAVRPDFGCVQWQGQTRLAEDG